MDILLDKRVYTPYGRGKVIAVFDNGTVCVKLDSNGGGVILRITEIFGSNIGVPGGDHGNFNSQAVC